MTLPDGTRELDRLFSKFDQNPWRDRDAQFRIGRSELPGNTADQLGFTDIVEAGAAATAGGLVNGDFASGPPDDTAIIDDEDNDLPGWDYVEVAGTWQVTWAASASGPAGYALSFTQAASAAGNEVYFEQTIPVAYYRRLVTMTRHSASNSNMGLKIAVAFLDETGAVIGSQLTNTYSTTTAQTSRFWREPPALAYEARIRIGCVNAAGSTGQTLTLMFVSVEEPTVYSVEVPYVYSFLSPAISQQYTFSHPSDIIPGGVHIADTQGFVLGIRAKTNDTISGGTGTVRAQNDTQATNPGPTVALSTGVTDGSATFSLDGTSSYHFEVDDELSMEISTNGSYASSGGADYYGSLRLMLVVNDEGDW